ncbi:hypothetical protein RRSWK_02919 [Rhodopirellula sp. SWK7]|nr:hypothetical protein RRSWK_02919 [Rhodopirellula sp. SWK7]
MCNAVFGWVSMNDRGSDSDFRAGNHCDPWSRRFLFTAALDHSGL